MVAGTERGVATISSSTIETFTLSQTANKIDLEITHDFYKKTKNDGTSHKNHIGSRVSVKNVGNVNLTNVEIHIDVDDNMPGFDAELYASDKYPSGTLGTKNLVLSFGNLSAGCTSIRKSYWWTIVPRFPGVTGSKERTARFNLYPRFNVDYTQGGEEIFVSEVSVSNA